MLTAGEQDLQPAAPTGQQFGGESLQRTSFLEGYLRILRAGEQYTTSVTSLAGKLQEILVDRRELGLLSIDLTLDLESLGVGSLEAPTEESGHAKTNRTFGLRRLPGGHITKKKNRT